MLSPARRRRRVSPTSSNGPAGVTSALGPDAATYVNFTGEANAALVRASYPADTYRRLVELKNEYDPTNLFRLNQNIAPTV